MLSRRAIIRPTIRRNRKFIPVRTIKQGGQIKEIIKFLGPILLPILIRQAISTFSKDKKSKQKDKKESPDSGISEEEIMSILKNIEMPASKNPSISPKSSDILQQIINPSSFSIGRGIQSISL